MHNYRIMQVGHDFIIFAEDVSILKCQSEHDAQIAIAVALDLLEHPDEWWNVLRQRLAASEAARLTENATDTAAQIIISQLSMPAAALTFTPIVSA